MRVKLHVRRDDWITVDADTLSTAEGLVHAWDLSGDEPAVTVDRHAMVIDYATETSVPGAAS